VRETGVEGVHHAATGVPVPTVFPANEPDPRVKPAITFNDFRGAIGRAIVDDDPFVWKYALSGHTSNRGVDEEFFIADGRDDDTV
jgi:hypothetical protein